MDWRKNGVKIVHAEELDMNTPQTSGMTRAAAITHAKAGGTAPPWRTGNRPVRGERTSADALGRSIGTQ